MYPYSLIFSIKDRVFIMVLEELAHKGIRMTTEAERYIQANELSPDLAERLIALQKPLISKEDIEGLLAKKPAVATETEIIRPDHFSPIAKEFSPDVKINYSRDVTGKSRTKGEVENFINHFRNRYERLSKMLKRVGAGSSVDLSEIKKHVNE